MTFQSEIESRSSSRLVKSALYLRRPLRPGSSPGRTLGLNPQPIIQRANGKRNQIPLFPPLSKGDQRGISRHEYLRRPQRSGSPEKEASISQPSKEAGLKAASSPKMCSGPPAAKSSLREDRPKSKRQSSSLPCAASSASG